MKVSKIKHHSSPKKLREFRDNGSFDSKDYEVLPDMGINIDEIVAGHSTDALEPTFIQGSANTPVQFLQNWLPGFVKNATTYRAIDDILGRTTVGSWEDEQIVQQTMERTGKPTVYGDYSEIPFSSYKIGHETRTIVRFEEGVFVPKLSNLRGNKNPGANDAQFRREAAQLALDIVRNDVGFNGFNNGDNKTYGLLNDPDLLPYVTLPNGDAGTSTWSSKTFLEITADLRATFSDLRTQSGNNVNPNVDKIVMAIASESVEYLSTTSDFGVSVQDWLDKNYKNVRVVPCAELDGANGGANVYYVMAESESVTQSTDGGQAMIQLVPNTFYTVGTETRAKGYAEDYSNALAGVMAKRPYLIVRRTGC